MLAMLLLRYMWWVYLANTYKLINESILELLLSSLIAHELICEQFFLLGLGLFTKWA